MKYRILTLAVVCALLAPAGAQQLNVADVPITKVVLFSSGVGYFEHAGQVDGDAIVRLSFKTGQISDVLKSMIVMDLSGKGTVRGVNYASRDPMLRALKSFAVDLSGHPSLGDLLGQLRGAEVVVHAPSEVQGRVLGIEQHTGKVLTDGVTTLMTETVLNLVTEDGIKSLPLSTIQTVELVDQKLAAELTKALDVILAERDTQRKPMDIHFAGEGKRDVRVGYLVEVPVWKTSYRLVLGKKTHLQGWAIVENTSDVDWSNVQLSLTSGWPISFIQDLYTPQYLRRPIVRPERYMSLRPQTHEGGMTPEEAEAEEKRRQEAYEESLESGDEDESGGGFLSDDGPDDDEVLIRTAEALASGERVGELFRFTITEPVTLGRRQSAMLPLINTDISAEKVSIYNPFVLLERCLNGVYLTNNTDMIMLPGPITVLDGGMYAGDARIDHFAPGEKRLISYAVDLDLQVDHSGENHSSVKTAKIAKGVMDVVAKSVWTSRYVIRNNGSDDRQVIVERYGKPEDKLLTPETYEEKTSSGSLRFRVPVGPGQTSTLVVTTERETWKMIAVGKSDAKGLLVYIESDNIPQNVRNALAKVAEMKQESARLGEALKKMEARKANIEKGQQRLRQNIETVGATSSLGKRYLAKLDDQESEIESLEEQITKTVAAITAADQKLTDYVKDLTIE
ncbi:hypothetical protein LCGC14_0226400 [marine sediment metagenome]|uniref:DUF4139 domain-containing protein n=1 Tax=marine sediment metagenome TaxID=412755 RepID=A0A0F9UT58_9ZZZZ|nr:hypothetical protein [Phycisphaerae bacterium]HDZ44041.1 hypothetical protein [Phycisphaerae bacterium]